MALTWKEGNYEKLGVQIKNGEVIDLNITKSSIKFNTMIKL